MYGTNPKRALEIPMILQMSDHPHSIFITDEYVIYMLYITCQLQIPGRLG